MDKTAVFESLLKQEGGRVCVDATRAGELLFDWEKGTTWNRINAGTFPLKTRKVGQRNVVSLVDLVDWICSNQSAPAAPSRGRPRKILGGEK